MPLLENSIDLLKKIALFREEGDFWHLIVNTENYDRVFRFFEQHGMQFAVRNSCKYITVIFMNRPVHLHSIVSSHKHDSSQMKVKKRELYGLVKA